MADEDCGSSTSTDEEEEKRRNMGCSQKLNHWLKHGVSIYQLILISHKSYVYKTWLLFDQVACLTSGYLNLYIATFIKADNK